jgi:ABC-2 type transport system permease protein
MLPLIFVLPIIQMIILTHAVDFELKNIRFAYMDSDNTLRSQELIHKVKSTGFFVDMGRQSSFDQAMEMLDRNQATLIIRIPPHFSRDLETKKKASIQMDINSIDGMAASLSYGYIQSVVADFQGEVVTDWIGLPEEMHLPVTVEPRFWFNPKMEYKNLMVPGVLALLITMIGLFLSAMNLVREKEIGTIEQINVTPIRKWQFLLGKLIPFLLIALFELGLGLVIGKVFFSMPTIGSIPLLFGFSTIYLFVILGIGLWISTVTDTQQQAMFIAWFFMVIFILMSGLFTPIENMPEWAQILTKANPTAYIVQVVRGILIKGSTFADLKMEFISVSLYAIAVNSFALLSYSKRT